MEIQYQTNVSACTVVPVKMIETGGPDHNLKIATSKHTLGHPLRAQTNGRKVRATTAPLPKVKTVATLLLWLLCSFAVADEQSDAEHARSEAVTISEYAQNEHGSVLGNLEAVEQLRMQVVAAINNVANPQLRGNLAGQMFALQPGGVFQAVRDSYYGTTTPVVAGTSSKLTSAAGKLTSGDVKFEEPNYPGAESDYEEADTLYTSAHDADCLSNTNLDSLRNSLENIWSQCAEA